MKTYQIFIFEQKQFLRHCSALRRKHSNSQISSDMDLVEINFNIHYTGLMDLPTNIISGPFGPFRFLGVEIGGGLRPFLTILAILVAPVSILISWS